MDAPAYIQEFFRVRKTDGEGLNASFDAGDPAENVSTTIDLGTIFRIRFKVRETGGNGGNVTFRIQLNKGGAGWVDVGVYTDTATDSIGPAVTLLSEQYANGAATNVELLTSTTANIDGEGLEADAVSSSFNLNAEELELEWALWLHGLHEPYANNTDDQTIEFRVVEGDGTAFVGAYTNPTITVNAVDGYFGGVIVETPSNIGVFGDGNGNLYYLTETSHTSNNIDATMMKSTDGGKVWAEINGAGRPAANDLEGVDIFRDGDILHIFIQKDGDSFSYNTFHTSDNATTPDTWVIKDEVPDAGSATAPIQVAGISVRADGELWAFWKEIVSGFDVIHYKNRTAGGTWDGSPTLLDNTASIDFDAFAVVLGESDLTHIFYGDSTNGVLYHKSLSDAGSLSARESVEADLGADTRYAFTQAVYWDDAGAEKIMVVFLDDSDQKLYSVVITDDGVPETRRAASDNTCLLDSEIGSDQVVANLAIDQASKIAYLHYVDATTSDIFRTEMDNDGGWDTDVEEQDGVTAMAIRGRVFTHSSGNGGATVVGYVWVPKIGSNDPTVCGFQRYDEFVIAEAVEDFFFVDHLNPVYRM